MTPEARARARNRAMVATSIGGEYVAPGLTGAEVVALNKLNPISGGKGKTLVEDGWRARGNDAMFVGAEEDDGYYDYEYDGVEL